MARTALALKRQIDQRQEFIEGVLDFVKMVALTYGKINIEQQKTEVINFFGFSFVYEGSSRSPRGERVIVWDLSPQGECRQVLSVHWFDIKTCEVCIFAESGNWQSKIKRLLKKGVPALVAELERKKRRGDEIRKKMEEKILLVARAQEKKDIGRRATLALQREAERLCFCNARY